MQSRTKILNLLEQQTPTIKEAAEITNMRYSRLLHHLRQMEKERYVKRIGDKRPFRWKLTGLGQRKLLGY
jgi:DNA-binding MarR family transcriptional regulator